MLYAGLPGRCGGRSHQARLRAQGRAPALGDRPAPQVPRVYAAGKANVQAPAREFTDLALRMSRGSVGFFERVGGGLGGGRRGRGRGPARRVRDANAQAVAATRDFAAWLEKDLLPRSTGSYALGAERFLTKLKLEEMIDLPLPELLARGQRNLEKDHAAFVATARQIDPRLTPAQVMATLENDHPTAEDLIPAVRRSLEGVRGSS